MSDPKHMESHGESARACEQSLQRRLQDLLAHHYGDGTVYLGSTQDLPVYRLGQSRALISDEGLLTAAGRSFLAAAGD